MDTQSALNIPMILEWRGHKFKLQKPNQKFQARFEAWCKQHVLKTLFEMKDDLTPDVFQFMLDETKNDMNTGAYCYGSPLSLKLMFSPLGNLAHVKLTLGKEVDKLTDDELADLLSEKKEQIAAFIANDIDEIKLILEELGWRADGSGKKKEELDPNELAHRLTEKGLWA